MLGDAILTVIAGAALLGAAWQLAGRAGTRPLPRLLATASIAAAAAVLQSLGLGLLGLGGTSGALAAAAVLTWLAVRLLVPAAPGPAVSPERRLSPLALLGLGALTGFMLALGLTQLHRPLLGQDAITYHLPEVVGWVQSGHPGRVLDVFYGLPVGNYPLTQEVLLAWVTGLSHGFAGVLVLTLAVPCLLLGAGWLGLGELGVSAPVRVLALAALLGVPLIVEGWTQPGTDLEALTWLVVCGALCLAARTEPGLLAPAIVAGGLGIGTKTTVITWVLATLATALVLQRRQLRAHLASLLIATLTALLTGLVWYLRNWITHGSPLWPFASFPGGDPRPRIISYLSTSLLASLHRTLLVHLHPYATALSGGVVLILGGILIGLPALALGRRRVALAAVVTLLGALEYAAGPVTGLPPGGTPLVGVVGSTLRYLMPVFAAGTVSLALAASEVAAPVLRGLGVAGLAGALVWALISDLGRHFALAYAGWLWVGALMGTLIVAALIPVIRSSARRRPRLPGGLLPVAGIALAVLLALAALAGGARHFSFRHVLTRDFAPGVDAFMLTQPGYADTRVPVASTGTGFAPLAGDSLQHPLTVIPPDASCARVAAIARDGYVLLQLPLAAALHGPLAHVVEYGTAPGCLLRIHARPIYDDGTYAVYAPLKSGSGLS